MTILSRISTIYNVEIGQTFSVRLNKYKTIAQYIFIYCSIIHKMKFIFNGVYFSSVGTVPICSNAWRGLVRINTCFWLNTII